MGHRSHPEFVTLHAVRIKGFAPVDTVADIAALPPGEVQDHLRTLESHGHVKHREARGLWQLTPSGRDEHAERLAADVEASGALQRLVEHYEEFLGFNATFKQLCTDWQLRDGAPNDHADAAYDRDVLARLDVLHADALPVVGAFGEALARFGPYSPRLDDVSGKVASGQTNLFTGVMCGSYHDVWMELHEDLILTQGIDRAAEGSF